MYFIEMFFFDDLTKTNILRIVKILNIIKNYKENYEDFIFFTFLSNYTT